MATAPHTTRPTPEHIFNALNAFQITAALKSAIEMDLFTMIGEGVNQAGTLAKRTAAAERGVRILADYLTVQGFLTKEGDRYALTPDTAVFLDRKSPAYMGSMTGFLATERHKQTLEHLTEAVRKGGSVAPERDNTKPHEEMWVAFAKSMAPLTGPSAGFMAQLAGMSEQKPSKILDVAASHGMFGITFAKQNPNARIFSLDWPAVLEVTKENASAAGVSNQLTLLPGSVFEANLGGDYDLVLLTNILHHFDKPTIESVLRRIHAALKPGGRAITLEFVPNEDRVSPPTAAAFSLIMLTGTEAGDAYTFSEYETMFRNAGFAKNTLHQIPSSPQQVVLSEKT
ncbi:MAG TPA: class I SAM-dependent methyltransferase [Candidatus Acidoferrum sp.]|jgi:2-polyprenyl-3-methyl-5-hydroxy-6-metoxy-1,4-benzoquinol methylase